MEGHRDARPLRQPTGQPLQRGSGAQVVEDRQTQLGPQAAQLIRDHVSRRANSPLTLAELQPLAVAKLMKAVVDKEQPGLVIVGKQAIDDDSNQTGQMLAALLGWSQGTFANKLNVADGSAEVKREVDGGLENIKIMLPAVITTDLRLNEPRYASLPNIMKAKKKPVDVLKPEDLGVDATPRLRYLSFAEPPKRQAGAKVGSVGELVAKLKDEAGVI